MRKMLLSLLAAFLLLALSACTDPSGQSEASSESESGMHIEGGSTGGGIKVEENDTADGYGGLIGFH